MHNSDLGEVMSNWNNYECYLLTPQDGMAFNTHMLHKKNIKILNNNANSLTIQSFLLNILNHNYVKTAHFLPILLLL